MLKRGIVSVAFVLSAAIPVWAQEAELDLPSELYTKLELVDGMKGTRDWNKSDAKRVMFTVNKDGIIDEIEAEVINLILAAPPFIAATIKDGEPINRTIEANLSPEAATIFSNAVQVETESIDRYFGAESKDANLLVFRAEKPIWPGDNKDIPEPYSDITAMSAAYGPIRWMTGKFFLNPSNTADSFEFASDTPALEGDLAAILQELQKADFYGNDWSPDCAVQGQDLSRVSKRTITQDTLDLCMEQAFGNQGTRFPEEMLTRALMLYQIQSAYEYANTSMTWPLPQN